MKIKLSSTFSGVFFVLIRQIEMKFVNTDLSKKSRKMLLTINNPYKDGTIPCNKALVPLDMLQAAYGGHEGAKQAVIEAIRNYIDNSDIIKGKTETYYCFSVEVGDKGNTPHVHIFFCFSNPRIGNKIKQIFPTAHIDYCNGSNQSCRDYVFKIGKWENSDKEETRISGTQWENGTLPEEKGRGERTDLEMIKDLIDNGMKPTQIFEINPNFYRWDRYVVKMFYDKRCKETPIERDVNVVVHLGVSGSGKTYVLHNFDENELFIGTDYTAALFDKYMGEDTLFLDEFRGQIPYNQLLTVINGYKVPVHARYDDVVSLWNNVHLTSVIPMEEWYSNDNIRDTYVQLKRRVSKVTYHFMTCGGVYIPDKLEFLRTHDKSEIEYHTYTVDSARYDGYEALEKEAFAAFGITMKYNSFLEEVSIFENENDTMQDEYEEWLKARDWEESASAFAEFWAWKTEQIKAADNVA